MKPDEKTIWRSPLPAVGDIVPKTAAAAAVASAGVCSDLLLRVQVSVIAPGLTVIFRNNCLTFKGLFTELLSIHFTAVSVYALLPTHTLKE